MFKKEEHIEVTTIDDKLKDWVCSRWLQELCGRTDFSIFEQCLYKLTFRGNLKITFLRDQNKPGVLESKVVSMYEEKDDGCISYHTVEIAINYFLISESIIPTIKLLNADGTEKECYFFTCCQDCDKDNKSDCIRIDSLSK